MIVEPCYEIGKPNQSILVLTTKATVSVRKSVKEVDATVYVRLLPSPRIDILTKIPGLPGLIDEEITNLKINNHDIPAHITSQTVCSDSGSYEVFWCPSFEPLVAVGDSKTQIDSVIFHLFNYEKFIGTRRSKEQIGTALYAIQRIEMAGQSWQIELKSLPTTSETFRTLNEQGVFGLTHVGSFQREDGTSFDGRTAEDMLHALRFFLSFSRGMWCTPCQAAQETRRRTISLKQAGQSATFVEETAKKIAQQL